MTFKQLRNLVSGVALATALAQLPPFEAHRSGVRARAVDRRHQPARGRQRARVDVPLVGDGLVIDHLSRDPDPRDPRRRGTRRLGRAAPSAATPACSPGLADDPDPEVRAGRRARRAAR